MNKIPGLREKYEQLSKTPSEEHPHYCRVNNRYLTLCRIHTCEYWGDCYKEFVDRGYELVPDTRKDNPTGLRWKLNKKS